MSEEKSQKPVVASTKKIIVLVGIAVILILALIVAVQGDHKDKTTARTTTSNKVGTKANSATQATGGIQEACGVLTNSIAQQVAGNGAIKQPTVPSVKVGTFNGSFCAYSGSKGTISLYVRSPLSTAGIDAIAKQFGSARPKKTQDVSGYGQAAYWDQQYYQFNVLKDSTWYVISAGSSTDYKSRTLDQAKHLADLIFASSSNSNKSSADSGI